MEHLHTFQMLFCVSHHWSSCNFALGFQDVKIQAKDLHPKLLGGMFFFFALGATGGILSLLTAGKPILERFALVSAFKLNVRDMHAYVKCILQKKVI